MDLSTELRLMIAEYALTSQEPLHWIWLAHGPRVDPGRCQGTFSGLEGLTSLCRTSRQLYIETKSIFWKLNDFLLDESEFGECWTAEPLDFRLDIDSLCHTYGFFVRTAGVENVNFLRCVILIVGDALSNATIEGVEYIAQLTPNARVEVRDNSWNLEHLNQAGTIEPTVDIDEYMSTGRELQDLAGLYDPVTSMRNWKVFPTGDNRYVLQKYLEGEELVTALAWEVDGI